MVRPASRARVVMAMRAASSMVTVFACFRRYWSLLGSISKCEEAMSVLMMDESLREEAAIAE